VRHSKRSETEKADSDAMRGEITVFSLSEGEPICGIASLGVRQFVLAAVHDRR
jgi:hypothetical protein